MPSLDTIRTVTIRGQADNVDQTRAALDRLTASIQAANQNLAQTRQVANDNKDGWRITGEGAANAANHLRQAAEAAYVFSPAFRSVVNEMAVPALKTAGTALEAVAAGIVTATNTAGAGVIRLGAAVQTTFPAFAVLGSNIKAAGAWMEAFSPTIGGVATSILSKLLPALSLLGKGLLIYDVIKKVSEAWELGNAKLAEYVALSEKAAASGLTTDFYQRIIKGAEAAKLPIDALTASFKKLFEAGAPTLGGTPAQNRLKELSEAGNFAGNSGVGRLQGANSNEERLRALADIYDQAVKKGERLAALDIAKAFGGDQLAANLAKSSDYLTKMVASADKLAAEDLISAATIANAVELQARYDAAVKILETRWHPIQDLLTALGIKMKETWVDIVEAIAKAVDAVFRLGQKIGEALAPAAEYLKVAAQFAAKVASVGGAAVPFVGPSISLAGRLASSALADAPDGSEQQRAAQMADARRRLAEGMNRKFDISTAPKPAVAETISAYERATDVVEKYIKVTDAAAASVGKSVGEQEKAKVVAQLLAAAQKDGTTVTAAMRSEMDKLAERAGNAAQALEKARIAADIKFNRDTALLSQEDVQIATALKGIYPDVATALGSVEAQAMRTNNAFREMGQAIENNLTSGLTDIVSGTKSVSAGFSDMAKSIIRSIEQMIIKIMIVEPLMRSLQSSVSGMGGSGGFGLGSLFGLGGSGSVPVMSGTGLGAGTGGLSFPMFAGGTDFAPGGPAIINEGGGEIVDLPSGARVIPHDISKRMADGGGQPVVMNDNRVINIGQGASQEMVAQLREELAQDRRTRVAQVEQIVRQGRRQRRLA